MNSIRDISNVKRSLRHSRSRQITSIAITLSSIIVYTLCIVTSETLAQTFTRIDSGAIVNDLGNSQGSCWGDFDDDGKIYVDLDENDLVINSISIMKIPYPWGPSVAEVRVWQ